MRNLIEWVEIEENVGAHTRLLLLDILHEDYVHGPSAQAIAMPALLMPETQQKEGG